MVLWQIYELIKSRWVVLVEIIINNYLGEDGAILRPTEQQF